MRLPRLHVVTDDSVLRSPAWEARAIEVLESGGGDLCLHLRGPRTDAATVFRLARALLSHARRAGAALFVNDRVDVALAADLDGVQLGERSLPVGSARALLAPDRWLGASCHSSSCAVAARAEGADYAFLGTIFPTPSHPGVEGMGREGLASALSCLSGFPVLGIGGIGPASVPGVRGAGAYGVAVVRGVWDARDPAEAVRRYVSMMDEEGERA
ncbi:MAG TPA: thiamine phosphate synthase [Longimicrobiales bacterium]|nr:thiamine phosphate synthase [Longimicrobiales bacterium]